ncbi:MAG: hypothetical protein WKG07_09545 [Hymenobacter sp.]
MGICDSTFRLKVTQLSGLFLFNGDREFCAVIVFQHGSLRATSVTRSGRLRQLATGIIRSTSIAVLGQVRQLSLLPLRHNGRRAHRLTTASHQVARRAGRRLARPAAFGPSCEYDLRSVTLHFQHAVQPKLGRQSSAASRPCPYSSGAPSATYLLPATVRRHRPAGAPGTAPHPHAGRARALRCG